MDIIKKPILDINKEDIFIDNQHNCIRREYDYNKYKQRYAIISSYNELTKYLPDDKLLHDTGKYILEYHRMGIYISFKDGKLIHFLLLNNNNYTSPYQDKVKIADKYNKNKKFRITQCLLRYEDNYKEYYIDFYVMELYYFLLNL